MYSLTNEECQKIINDSKFTNKSFTTFIETGTFKGGTIDNIRNKFDDIHTIELSKELYDYNVHKFRDFEHIKVYFGDSSDIFPTLLRKINSRSVFFLDGHWSSGWQQTAQGEKDCPLVEEITSIKLDFKNDCIVIIDDFRLFGTKEYEDWSDINSEILIDILDDRVMNHYVDNDRLIIEISKPNE